MKFELLLILFILISAEVQLPIGLIFSSNTEKSTTDSIRTEILSIKSRLQNILGLDFPLRFYWDNIDLTSQNNKKDWKIPEEFINEGVTVILDFTNDLIYSQFLAFESLKSDFLHIVVDRPLTEVGGETTTENTLFLQTSFENQALAFIDLIDKHGWSHLALIYDEQIQNLQLAEAFKQNLNPEKHKILDELILDSEETLWSRFMNRLVYTTRDSGARVILVFSGPIFASLLLHAADECVMGGSGYAWILSSEAMKCLGEISRNSNVELEEDRFGVLKTGSIGLVEHDCSYIQEHPFGLVESVLTLVVEGYLEKGFPVKRVRDIKGGEIWSYLLGNPEAPSLEYYLHFDKYGVKIGYYDIYNIEEFVHYKVGIWESDSRFVELDLDEIVWPGESFTPPNDEVLVVKLALLVPMHDEKGFDSLLGPYVLKAFDLALEQINSNPDFLEDFILEADVLDSYMSTSLATVNLKSLSNNNIIAFVGSFDSEVTKEYLNLLNASEDYRPMISYGASSYFLSSDIDFECFLRTIQPDGLQAAAIAFFIEEQDWQKIGVIYTEDDVGKGIYMSFIENLNHLDIKVLNKEEKRKIVSHEDEVITEACKDSIEEALTELIRQQVKVVVYLGNYIVGAEIAKRAYEKELYGDEYAWIGSIWINEKLQERIQENYSDEIDEIYEVLEGAVGLSYLKATGEIGSYFETSYEEKYGEEYSIFGLYVYDTVYLLANIIHTMHERGEDFYNPEEFMNSLRAAEFTGASGQVKFSPGSNDRLALGYSIVNMQNREIKTVMNYNPNNATQFEELEGAELQWSGKNRPNDSWDEEFNCPFAEHMVSVTYCGLGVLISIGLFLFGITVLLSYFSLKKWNFEELSQINSLNRTWKDTVAQLMIFIEFFQFVAIAPTLYSAKQIVEIIANLFMLDIIKVAEESEDRYWILLSVIIPICYLWFILFVLVGLMPKPEGKPSLFYRTLDVIYSFYLPFIGNNLFLPILALLLDVFKCDHQAQGKPYVWRDCYMNCWTGDHLNYIIAASLALILYEPLAAYSRPLWQHSKEGLHIKATPEFLLTKTCVEILLVTVGNSLEGISPISHGVVFSVLMGIFSCVTFFKKPFNYERSNLWEIASLIAVSYLSILATISYLWNPTHYGWSIALCIGWGSIGGLFFWIERRYRERFVLSITVAKSKFKPVKMSIVSKRRSVIPVVFDEDEDDIAEDEIKVYDLDSFGEAMETSEVESDYEIELNEFNFSANVPMNHSSCIFVHQNTIN